MLARRASEGGTVRNTVPPSLAHRANKFKIQFQSLPGTVPSSGLTSEIHVAALMTPVLRTVPSSMARLMDPGCGDQAPWLIHTPYFLSMYGGVVVDATVGPGGAQMLGH